MRKKHSNRLPTTTTHACDLATTRRSFPACPKKPAHLDEIAGREWDRLVTERHGRPRTMSLHRERLLLTAAAQAYRYGWAIGNLARHLGVPVANIQHEEWRTSYEALCDALDCMPVDPFLRDS
jgi:hypothetical protein